MFKIIFVHEIGYWIRNPLPYLYALFLFSVSLVSMWGMAGEEVSGPGMVIQNAPFRLNYLTNYINQLVIFFLPSIIGLSIYRDYSSRIFQVLYSYPIAKSAYLLAKFSSAFLVSLLVAGSVGWGFAIGAVMPGVNPDAVVPFSFDSYANLYGIFIIPTLFILSIGIFIVVAHTRNIYLGFMLVIVYFILHNLNGNLPDYVSAWLDPTGGTIVNQVTRFWTLSEKNTLDLPITGFLIANRMLWLTIVFSGAVLSFSKFKMGEFNYNAKGFKKTRISNKDIKSPVDLSTHIIIKRSFDLKHQLITVWRLSNTDLRSILLNWPFLVILMSGFLMVFIQQKGMAPQHGVPILPTTSEMLRIPMFIFSAAFNLLTFLYAGILIFRDKSSRMHELTYTAPQPEWVFLFTRLLAIFKMQFVLLAMVGLSGIIVQTIHGYHRYEIGHYLFELYGIHLLHFMIWACVAFFIHSLIDNMYVSFIILLLVPIGVMLLPAVGETMGWSLLQEHFLHFNQVPGLYVGFDYSDFNQYGSALSVYYFFKLYWSLGAVVFILLALLIWERSLTHSWKERWVQIKSRFQGRLKISLVAFLILFIGMGANVYYQEHHVSKTFYTDEDEDYVYAENEIRYSSFIDKPQPRLKKAVLNMDIFPKTRDYHLSGSLFFVHSFHTPVDTILVGTSFKDDVAINLLNPSSLISNDKELRYYIYKLDRALNYGDTLKMTIDIRNHPNSLLHDNSRVLTNGTFITGQIIPTLGVRQAFLTNVSKRKKYGLNDRTVRDLSPADSTLLGSAFMANNMDRIEYETVVTTSGDQYALSMGNLITSGTINGRNYFHYKSEGPIKNNISWLSGRYDKVQSSFGSKILNIYHHPWHTTNLKYLKEGALASLNYCEKWFSPLQHDTLNLVEFPMTAGSYATLNGNLIPFSESKMLCDIDHEKNEEYNHPYFVAAHEVAHYWWGHKVDPANVNGGKLISESMAEYIAKQVISERFGEKVIREDRKKQLSNYFELRAKSHDEVPLIYARLDQDYLNYIKGGQALTTLSKYLGETEINRIFAAFEEKYRHKDPPYPTSLDFVGNLRSHTPDSLQYLITDLFETITIFDMAIQDVRTTGDSTILKISYDKKRTDGIGKVIDQPAFSDYIRIGLYHNGAEDIHLVKIDKADNEISLVLNYKPDMIVLDPEILLPDIHREDNIWNKN